MILSKTMMRMHPEKYYCCSTQAFGGWNKGLVME